MRIYLSYRPDDGLGWPKILFEELCLRFGQSNVFDSGSNANKSHEEIAGVVAQCDALLAVIGPNFLKWAADAEASKAGEITRVELGTASQRGLRLLAVRVGGVPMPKRASLPEELKGLAEVQAPELTTSAWRAVITDLIMSLNPDRWRRLLRRAIEISSGAVCGVFVGVGAMWYASGPNLDPLWSNFVFNIEFGSSSRKYFDRSYAQLYPADEYRDVSSSGNSRNAQQAIDVRWESKPAKAFLDASWREFACLSERDQVTFVYESDKLMRISFRFCADREPCKSTLLPTFSSLTGKVPVGDANERYFEAAGEKLDMLGWSGYGLTVVDLAAKGARPLKGEAWFKFLRGTVLKNQCGRELSR